MAKLDRQQLQNAIQRSLPGSFRIVDADVDDDDKTSEAEPGERSVPALPAPTLKAMRTKYSGMVGKRAGAPRPIEKSSQFVVIEPDDELVTDFKAPHRRVRIVSSKTGEVETEQG